MKTRHTIRLPAGRMALTCILFFLLQPSLSIAQDKQIMYIHSARAPVHMQPDMNSPKVTELASGMEILVMQEKGFWYNIIHKEHQGWVFKQIG